VNSKPLRQAFTLLELLLVVAMLGVLAAFALPDFQSTSRAKRLTDSAERLQTLIVMCRAEAMNETVRHRIRIRPDGTLRVLRQADPLKAPHLYIRPRVDWAQTTVLLDDVWIEAIQLLPEGPPPLLIVNDRLEFPDAVIEPVPIEEMGGPIDLDFEPDGTVSNSLRCVLRDTRGLSLLVTLDGRLGRVTIENWTTLPADEVHRPDPWPEESEPEYRPEDFK
jgi:prepilin-type N-terminal cleavage/methylation domain-containing protein